MSLTPTQCYRWVIVGAAVLFVGLLGARALSALRSPDGYSPEYVAALIHAHTRQLQADRDSHRAATVAAETVYVAARQTAIQHVARVEPSQLAGDTITFADDSAFVIPHRVTLLLVAQRDAISSLGTALAAADSLVAKFHVEREASDRLLVGVQSERDALARQVQALTPGRMARAWGAVRVPLTFVAGVAVGAYAVRQVTQ